MTEESLSPYLARVLEVFQHQIGGVLVDPETGEPDPETISRLAVLLGDDEDDVRNAVLGLRQCDCLMEDEVSFPGAEDLLRWTVHPQCADREQRPRVERPSPAI